MKKLFKNLTFQVIFAIILGILVGQFAPKEWMHENAGNFKVLADIFIKMIKMVIGPIVFFTIVLGISNMGNVKKVGRIGGKAILYFEIVSTIALALGILSANWIKPGSNMDISKTGGADISQYTQSSEQPHGIIEFLTNIVPDNAIGAFANGQLLPILFFAIFFGFAMASLGERAKPVTTFFESANEIFFKIVSYVMNFSSVAAFGAMVFTIGNFGIGSLVSLGKLLVVVFGTMAVFIFVVLGIICKINKINLLELLKFIKKEILVVIATSSSEAALPGLMKRLEEYGCSKSVVGLVLPTGYSFNLDGTNIYLALAAIFIAQAYGVDLTLTQEITLLGILMLTSKGAAGVTGAGFITLAATLSAFPMVPVQGIALLLGVDRFMSAGRSITNIIGNAVATVIIAKSEKEFKK